MKLQDKINATAPVVVGLDPRLEKIPKRLGTGPEAVLAFNKAIIDAVADLVPAVKLQLAFYELLGVSGMDVFWKTAKYAKEREMYVIADGKRNDIGSTAKAYAEAYLGRDEVDALTVTPYLGSDGIKPFTDRGEVFLLVKTSNPSSGELQDLDVGEKKLYAHVAELVNKHNCNAVVGATYPEQAAELRELMPDAIFLVPGYGAQGGGAKDVLPCFKNGQGAIVNSSRGIIHASTGDDFAEKAREAAEKMIADIKSVL
ncbi:MAG: orotidine-5'-phosphate decarboxylase [Candidatus Woesearchaeota archaeon]|nr:orotidine-5'-phosphate decarboxylase [Candidatus Woesearchaeota archaeon]